MEPNKMEEEFRAKLNQREITPSEHAWDRLDAMLNEKEETKVVPVRRLNWLYIAAGFVGIILVGTMFFRSGEANQNTGVAVEEVKENPIQNSPEITPVDSLIENVTPEINNVPTQQQTEVAASEPKHQKIQQQTNKVYAPNTMKQDQNQTQVANVERKEPTTNDQRPATNNRIINQSINNPVNAKADEQLAAIEPTRGEAELGGAKFQDPKAIKVDANSLLSQVDGELELSFREKVIRVASKKYQNVKVALANRNQE